ncbi:MAG: Mg2 transporter protein CorA family protein [Modestobacter sp.]|nr:Mg2 transporter protein CorA family protein [Modestobacter sp.]
MTDALIPEPEPAAGDPHTPGRPATSVTSAVPPRCPTRTRLYRAGQLVAEGFSAEQISDHLAAHEDAVVWLDLLDPNEADLSIVTLEFGLHPLAVEDAIHDHQRPKLDRYRSHLFANMYAVQFEELTGELATGEISVFITPRALITVRKSDFDVDTLIARWDTAIPDVAGGVGSLVYGLLDAVVDGHSRAIEQLDDGIDELENALFETRADVDIRRRGFELRKSLVQLRRVVLPMREVVARVLRNDGDLHLAAGTLEPYYQDVYDHVVRAAEGVETARELVNGALETNLNEQTYQLTETTKKLAAWAAIIAVPTAITGFYGQNVPYPGFSQHSGFLASTIMIIVLAGGLYVLLRRRGWL